MHIHVFCIRCIIMHRCIERSPCRSSGDRGFINEKNNRQKRRLALLRPSEAVSVLHPHCAILGIFALLFLTRVRGRPQDFIHRVSTLQVLQRSSSDLPPSPLRRVGLFTPWVSGFPSPFVLLLYHSFSGLSSTFFNFFLDFFAC